MGAMKDTMNIPNSLDHWSYGLVQTLVDEGYLETDYFDFKGELSSHQQKHNENLTKISCAFANTRGGFIVFGISDLDQAPKRPRISGITNHADLAKEFGDRIRTASPTILFDFRNPPITLPNSRKVLFIVHVPRSSERPHMTLDGKFWYRTNEGNKLMSYEQVRESFLRYEERTTKIKQLLIELLVLQADAKSILGVQNLEEQYSILTLDTSVMNALLVDIYSMIQDDYELLKALISIRRMAKVINTQTQTFLAGTILPRINQKAIVKEHNLALMQRTSQLESSLSIAIAELERRYALKEQFTELESKSPPVQTKTETVASETPSPRKED